MQRPPFWSGAAEISPGTQQLAAAAYLEIPLYSPAASRPPQAVTPPEPGAPSVPGLDAAPGVPEARRRHPSGEGRDEDQQKELKELYSAGNLIVLGDALLSSDPVQLDFHFKLGSRGSAYWHGTLSNKKLFLETPSRVLDQGNRESLTAALEFVEVKTNANFVFVNFSKARNDRGELLRAFSYLGFEVVRPGHPSVPAWEDVIFMVYSLERELPSSH
ncbi:ornithine decarboxylase antizyme 3 [Ambystoma mexicanum]|uniref:ornithine decarboxylase antizyme 3 n=1 Tax=Ambystoma mexicanum TaxID=8296 RepID=UPI0037E78C86